MPVDLLHPFLAELDAEDRQEVSTGILATMADRSWRALPAYPCAFLIVVLASEDMAKLGPAFGVAAFIALAATAWRLYLARRFEPLYERSPTSWRRLFASSLLITGVSWGGAAATAILATGFSLASFFATTITVVFLAHATIMYGSQLWLINAYSFTLSVPVLAALVLAAPQRGWIGALGGALFLLYNHLHGRSQHTATWRSAVDSRLLRSKNRELERTHASLSQAHASLEQEVQKRTADYERVEADLRQRESDYRQIFEAVHDAILIFRPEGEIILNVNRRACEIYGYRRDQLIGRSIMTFSLDPGRGKERVGETLGSETPNSFRTRQRRRDGSEIVLDINASVIEYRGEPAILSVNRDVTAQLRSEELRLAKEAAERANRAKSGFLANMSHEIRTPMAGVIGLSDLMLKTELSRRQKSYADTIRSSALSLLEVIDDILDFSKIEAGKLTLDSSVVDLAELVDRAVELLHPRATAKGIEIFVDLDERLPDFVLAPPARLRQVLLNLVGNAVKFTEGGEVECRVTVVTKDSELARIRFTVRDTGIGMTETMLPRLFSPFTQADASTSRRFGGSGLGLAISQQLVQLMGGEIEVESTEGEGSVFYFELTLEIAEAKDDNTTGSRFRQKRDAHILVAEDNPVNQLVILEQLADLGYRADAVASGKEVLRAIQDQSFDLILMDCQMPGLDGYETTRRLRGQEVGDARLPIVALTAHAMKGDREKCLDAGMDDYISKPFTESRLAKILRRWLNPLPSNGAAGAELPGS